MMPPRLRPVGPERPPLRLPDREWSEDQRRFLEVAIRYADEMRGWVLKREADRLERDMGED